MTWQNPEQLFVAQVLINKVKSKCCGIKVMTKRNCPVRFTGQHFTIDKVLIKGHSCKYPWLIFVV